MSKNIMWATFLFSLLAYGNSNFEENEVKNLMLDYQISMDKHDKNSLKKTVTPGYFQNLTKNNLLDRLFKLHGPKKSKREDYHVKVIESEIVKDSVMAQIKRKDDKAYDKNFYRIKKVDGKYKIFERVQKDH